MNDALAASHCVPTLSTPGRIKLVLPQWQGHVFRVVAVELDM